MKKLQQLDQIIKAKGGSEADLALVVQQISQESALELYSYLISTIKPTDAVRLEELTGNQASQKKLINKLVQNQSGQTVADKAREIQEKLIDKFLEGYQLFE
ncbi:MAG: hypothetical protein GF381_02285 [Candidatus Pacebacteria bacterium]|nr:hypothetical protein [Candidatus Paceibacterota bacterium]